MDSPTSRKCPQCGRDNPPNAWICQCGWEFPPEKGKPPGPKFATYKPGEKRHRHHSRRKSRPIFAAIWFTMLGLLWFALILFALHRFRPHPLSLSDKIVGGFGFAVALFYLWVGYAVFRRRNYIWNIAFACAGVSLANIPFGTIIGIALICDLQVSKHEFMR